MHRKSVGALVAVCAIVACSEAADPGRVLSPEVASLSQGIVASAVGSAHYMSGGELRTMSFNAVATDDGSAKGNFQVHIHAIDRFFRARVTCMATRNDTAWVAGIVEDTNHPNIIPGRVSYFWTVDNGEGQDTPDKMSTARINDAVGEDQRFCSLQPDEAFSRLPGNVLLHGNVQVNER